MLVARQQCIDDLVSFIPLYFDGLALALYLEMEEKDQLSTEKIEDWLMEALAEGPFMAYGQLGKARWMDEQADVFADEIN